MDHTFVIPAYGQSPHLEACIRSIQEQTSGTSHILMGTSTPSAFLSGIARKFAVELRINPERSGIAGDWNFIMQASDAGYLTIAHQDDVYDPDYLMNMALMAEKHPDMVLAFSDYCEQTETGHRRAPLNLKIKRWLCNRAFAGHESVGSRVEKMRLLRWGNPICCPSVMLNRTVTADFQFSGAWKTNLDWDAWLRLADMPGAYVYCRKSLISKRVHVASETSVTIADKTRQREDFAMFCRFWPKPLATLIGSVYKLGYLSNRT